MSRLLVGSGSSVVLDESHCMSSSLVGLGSHARLLGREAVFCWMSAVVCHARLLGQASSVLLDGFCCVSRSQPHLASELPSFVINFADGQLAGHRFRLHWLHELTQCMV